VCRPSCTSPRWDSDTPGARHATRVRRLAPRGAAKRIPPSTFLPVVQPSCGWA